MVTPPNPKHLEALIRHFADHEKWAEDSLTIRNQQGIPVPFRTYPGPHKLNAAIEKQRKKGKPVRIISVKARRVFMSAGIATHGFKQTAFFPGRHGLVIAHRSDSAEEIFDYYSQFATSYRPAGSHLGGAIELPRRAKTGNREGAVIKFVNNSWLRVATAGSKHLGRSMGLHFLHISEAAYIDHLRRTKIGLLNTMPDDAETMAFEESTANGASGEFYEDWQDASDARSGSDWEPVFLAWWEHPANYLPLSVPPDAFESSLSGEEKGLRQTYGLNQEQLNWRRWAIANKCDRSHKLFAQEYPSCAEEAFLTSGRPRFNHISLSRMPIIREPIAGNLREVDTGTKKRVIFEPSSDGRGPLLLYRRPEAGKVYTIGADPASGADPNFRRGEEADSDPDFSVATVLDCSSGEQVAKIRERWTPPLFAEWLWMLGQWFGWAYLVPEANNHGQAVIAELLRLQYPLDRIHVKRRIPGDRRPPMLNEIGFLTNVATRPDLISGLDGSINEMSVIIRDANTLAECLKFVVWPDGIPRAQRGKGNHDDEVIALALARIGLIYAPRVSRDQMRTPQSELARRKTSQVIRYGPYANRGVMREED